MTFADELKKARLDAGHTQRSAAELLGVSFSTYCNWERGRTAPPSDKVLTQGEVLMVLTVYGRKR